MRRSGVRIPYTPPSHSLSCTRPIFRQESRAVPMNGNLFKVVLISVIAILLAIVGGAMSADGDPVSIALAMTPFVLAGLYLMKEKVWYLWVWLPAFFCFSCSVPVYQPWDNYIPLCIYSITLPFYLWNIILKRTSFAWNSIRLLDIFILILFAYVAYSCAVHPFGIGIDILNDFYGGKGYITFLGAILAYVCLSSLKTDSTELGKILKICIILIFIGCCIGTIKNLISPESTNFELHAKNAEAEGRFFAFVAISTFLLEILIIKYSLSDLLKHPLAFILVLLSIVGGILSGTRHIVIFFAIFFFSVSILYKRWIVSIILPLAVLSLLFILSETGAILRLPYGIQRTLYIIPSINVSPDVKAFSDDSSDFRIRMWKYALDDKTDFIHDKVWGDGFSRPMNIFTAYVYEKAYGLKSYARKEEGGNQEGFMYNRVWHNGTLNTIHALGYIGATLCIIIIIVGAIYSWITCRIYAHHKYRVGILYLSINFISQSFLFIILNGGPDETIPALIISLGMIKVLFCCAKREGLYVSFYVRKDYVPLMIRQTKKNLLIPKPAEVSG